MKDNKHAVSIIVTIYNTKEYFDQCLDSVLSQSFRDIEIILVDDGSTDGSSELCDVCAQNDQRVIVLHQKNTGVSTARNNGMNVASGEWIMFVDGDDWITEDAVEALYEQAVSNDNCDLVAGSYFFNYPSPHERENFAGDSSRPGQIDTLDLNTRRMDVISYALGNIKAPELLAVRCNLRTPWAKLYRRSTLEEHQLQFISGMDRGEDRIFNLYVLKYASKLVSVNVPVYHSRIHTGSLSKTFLGNEPLSDSIELWVHETRTFLDAFSDTDDLYARFLYYVLIITADFYINGIDSDSMSRSEAAKNLRLMFHRENYKNWIRTIDTHIHDQFVSFRDRFTFNLLKRTWCRLYFTFRKIYGQVRD